MHDMDKAGYVEKTLQHTHHQITILPHASHRDFARAAEGPLHAADAKRVDDIRRQSEGHALILILSHHSHLRRGENGSLLEDAVEVDVGDGAAALDEDVVVVPVAQADHVAGDGPQRRRLRVGRARSQPSPRVREVLRQPEPQQRRTEWHHRVEVELRRQLALVCLHERLDLVEVWLELETRLAAGSHPALSAEGVELLEHRLAVADPLDEAALLVENGYTLRRRRKGELPAWSAADAARGPRSRRRAAG